MIRKAPHGPYGPPIKQENVGAGVSPASLIGTGWKACATNFSEPRIYAPLTPPFSPVHTTLQGGGNFKKSLLNQEFREGLTLE
jgi:hypothetical protein